ncbi:MAG: alpha/beta hydrolase [Candidatus Limnocylindrales bacterium]
MTIRSFGGGLFGARVGAGTPRVLALHGWGRDHADLMAVLVGDDGISLDLPGFGASPAPDTAWGAEQYAAVVASVLPQMAPRIIVVGHSFGGRVAVKLARAHPGAVGGLVLVGVPLLRLGPVRRPSLRLRIARALHRSHLLSDSRIESMRRRSGSVDYQAATGVMRQVLVRAVNEEYAADLPLVTCAVELVWGADDEAVPAEVARRAAELLPRSALTLLPGVGHHVTLQDPAAIRAAIARIDDANVPWT